MAMKQEADSVERELEALPRWRRKARAELSEIHDELRTQERRLLAALGGRP
jgi:hypothetical protein